MIEYTIQQLPNRLEHSSLELINCQSWGLCSREWKSNILSIVVPLNTNFIFPHISFYINFLLKGLYIDKIYIKYYMYEIFQVINKSKKFNMTIRKVCGFVTKTIPLNILWHFVTLNMSKYKTYYNSTNTKPICVI